FASFQGGMGELSDALAKEVSAAAIRTGAAVSQLIPDGAGYRLRLDDGGELSAQGVVLATPAPETAAILSPVLSQAAAAVAGIGQVATATVTLGYRADDIPNLTGSGFVVPTAQKRKIMGVSYLSRKWAGRVPDSRFELLRAFVGGTNGQELALAEEDRLVAVVRGELEALVGITATPVLTRTFSWRRALHQYTLGHLDRVARAEAHLAPGLALAGAAFHGIGLNECVESGRRAADRVLATVPQVA
ncbi:MAG: protoporphyrinogen oxidase, partial [Acidimicrobiia bacterium]